MQVTWVIQNNSIEDNVDTLASIIEKQNGVAKVVPYRPFEDVNILDFPPADAGPIFAAGSISWIKNIQKHAAWVPGPIATWRNYSCDVYYAHYGKFLYNKNYMMMPLKEVYRRFNDLYQYFHGPIFIRPSSGLKQFTGEVFYQQKDLQEQMEKCNHEILCVVAPKRTPREEFRFICSHDKIITGSMYRNEYNEICREPINWNEISGAWAARTAMEVLAFTKWRPDPIFAMDIAFTIDKVYDYGEMCELLEINSLSSSGWYACDLNKIVEAVNNVAVANWKDVYEI